MSDEDLRLIFGIQPPQLGIFWTRENLIAATTNRDRMRRCRMVKEMELMIGLLAMNHS